MKTITLLSILIGGILSLQSCGNNTELQHRTNTMEGCEYVVVGIGNHQWGSHKGNCKNPVHKVEGANIQQLLDSIQKLNNQVLDLDSTNKYLMSFLNQDACCGE